MNHIAAIARLVSGMTDSKCKFSDGNVNLASLGSILSSAIDLLRYVSLPSMPLGLPQTVFRVLFSVLPSGRGRSLFMQDECRVDQYSVQHNCS